MKHLYISVVRLEGHAHRPSSQAVLTGLTEHAGPIRYTLLLLLTMLSPGPQTHM